MQLAPIQPIEGELLPNIDKLRVGMRLNSYKDLCTLMNEPIKNGTAKTAQLAKWKRFFNYITEGYAIIIVDKYKEPLAKIDGRQAGNNNIWLDKISLIFLDHLVANFDKTKSKEIYLSKMDIVEIVGLCNESYKEGKGKSKKDIEEAGIAYIQYRDFFYTSGAAFNTIVSRMLESLSKRYIIECLEVYKVKRGKNGKFEECIEEERENIRKIYGKVLDAMGLKSRQDAYLKHRNIEFYKQIDILLKEIGILEHYTIQKISFHSNVKERTDNYRKTIDKVTLTREDINNLSVKARRKELISGINKQKNKEKLVKSEKNKVKNDIMEGKGKTKSKSKRFEPVSFDDDDVDYVIYNEDGLKVGERLIGEFVKFGGIGL